MDSKKKILSICIPTYNRKNKLDTCLSFLVEDYLELEDEIEVVISDNCSTDLTEEMIKEKYPIFFKNYFKSDKNYGPQQNFYTTVLKATGKFVWLIGDDDFVLPGIVRHLVNIIKNEEALEYIMVNDYNWYPDSNNQTNLSKKEILELVYSKRLNVSINDFDTKYVNKVIDFVGFISDSFTPIYSNVMLREHWVDVNKLGYESSKKYKPFENLLSCNANSYWIVKNLHNKKGLYFGTPALLVSFDIGWTEYMVTWLYKILPELYALERRYGADSKKIKEYKTECLKINHLITSSFKKKYHNRQTSFDFKSFILGFYDVDNFGPTLLKISKEYSKNVVKKLIKQS